MNEEITNLSHMNRNINHDTDFNIKEKRISILNTYGTNFNKNEYITNPSIGRDKEL